jgi:lysophospholipase L1-like esterase
MQIPDVGLQIAAAATVPLLPFVRAQGQRVRESLSRVAGASGPCTGVVHRAGLPVRLLVFGESTAASVGAPTHEEGLAGQVARTCAERTGRSVHWRAHGQRGVTARAACDRLLPTLPRASSHAAVVALGVSDVIQLHSPLRWRRDLERLVANLRARTDHPPVIVAGMPPIGRFPALPEPLRSVLAWRGRLLDRAARHVASSTRTVTYVAAPIPKDREAFCPDGVHPAPPGYAVWGASLGRAVAKVLAPRRR